jgi:membrane protease YdiL (CAAX protease family)
MTGPDTGTGRADRGAGLAIAAVPFLVFLVAQIVVAAAAAPGNRRLLFFSPGWAVGSILIYGLLVAATWRVTPALDPSRAVLGLRRTPLLPAVGLAVGLVVVGSAASLLLEPVFHAGAGQDLRPLPFPGGASATAGLALTTVVLVMVGPFAEELYFRGLVLGAARPFGTPVAIAGSALFFALSHFEPAGIPVIVILGVLLGYARVRTRSVWPPIAIHAVNNAIALALALH